MAMPETKTNGEAIPSQTTTVGNPVIIGNPVTPPIGKAKVKSNAEPSLAEMQAELARLRAENTALKAKDDQELSMKVGPGGTWAVYGLGKFPVAMYAKQWLRLLAVADKMRGYLENQFKLYESNPTGYKAGQVTGQAFFDYPAKDDQPAFRAILTFEKSSKTTKASTL